MSANAAKSAWGILQDGKPSRPGAQNGGENVKSLFPALRLFNPVHNIGRAELNADSKYVSRVHFTVGFGAGGSSFIKAASQNDTFLNGAKLTLGQSQALAHGDVITLVRPKESEAMAVCRFLKASSKAAPAESPPHGATPPGAGSSMAAAPPGAAPLASAEPPAAARREALGTMASQVSYYEEDDREDAQPLTGRKLLTLTDEISQLEHDKEAYVRAFEEEHHRPPAHDELRSWPDYRKYRSCKRRLDRAAVQAEGPSGAHGGGGETGTLGRLEEAPLQPGFSGGAGLRSGLASPCNLELGLLDEEDGEDTTDGCQVDEAVVPPDMPRQARHRFNQDPKAAVKWLVAEGYEGGTCDKDVLARWFLTGEGLSTNKLGQWLGGSSELQQTTLTHYASLLSFKGLTLDRALRYFLSLFKLPGEAQQIDRIMQAYADSWSAANPTDGLSAETA